MILGSFPIVLILSTIGTLAVSWLITKSGPLRYFFGLPTKKESYLPGKALNGMVPVIVMSFLFIVAAFIVDYYLYTNQLGLDNNSHK